MQFTGEVLEAVAVEQMLNSLPVQVRMQVSEWRPWTVAEVGQLADDFAQAQAQGNRLPAGG